MVLVLICMLTIMTVVRIIDGAQIYQNCGEDFAVLNRVGFCFPSNYSRIHRPQSPDAGEEVDQPLEVQVDIDIIEVSQVNDLKRTLTLLMYLTLSWRDNRKVCNLVHIPPCLPTVVPSFGPAQHGNS